MHFDTSSSADYTALLDLNNLHEAFLKSSKGVSWKESVQRFAAHEFRNLSRLRRSLIDHTYKQKPFYEFDLYERGKLRHIKSLHISDRVLQRALCDKILIPRLSKYLIYDNGASLKGKGIDFSRRRIVRHLQSYFKKHGRVGYILLMDCSKYFESLDHDVFLHSILDKVDEDTYDLVEYLTRLNPGDKGFGIGSQLSQIAGVYYLTPLDTYLKISKSIKYYGRYMDDFYIISDSKEELQVLLVEVRGILTRLKIKLNEHKTQIYRIDKGFVYLKLKHILNCDGTVTRIPCKSGIRRERKKIHKLFKKNIPLNDIEESYNSWRGNVLKYRSYKMVRHTDDILEREKIRHYNREEH